MLELFFTIVFIAELIIAGWLISHLRKWDKKVCDLNLKVLEVKPKICKILTKFKNSVEYITKGYNKAVTFVANQKSNILNAIIKNIVVLLLIFLLKIPGKKAIAFFDVVSMLIKIFKKPMIKKVCS
ncbi:hypothetical protein IJ541_08635 [bacterium]|nr:hypothetical protein [bacterium]